MYDSLPPHGLQHARPPCPSPIPGVYSNSCPLSQWCHPTISSPVIPSAPTFHLSQHPGHFKWVSSLHQVAKVLDFSFSINPSSEYSGLISFRRDWFDVAVQGTLKSLLQHYSSKASILLHSAFFTTLTSIPKDKGKQQSWVLHCVIGSLKRQGLTENYKPALKWLAGLPYLAQW